VVGRLSILPSYCSGLGHCNGAGLIPGPGPSTCCRFDQKKKKKKKKQLRHKRVNMPQIIITASSQAEIQT